MLSIKKESDKPIAFIDGGVYNGKVVYLHDVAPSKVEKDDAFFNRLCLEDGVLRFLPEMQKNQVSRICFSSAPGAGKSTLLNEFIKTFHRAHNADKTLVFTKHTEEDLKKFDPSYSENLDKVIILTIDDSIIDDPIKLMDLYPAKGKERLVVFDDYTDLPFKMQKAINSIRDDIVNNGRKFAIHCCSCHPDLPVTNREFRNYLTKSCLVYFKNYAPCNIKSVLEKYYGINDKIFAQINHRTNSRWIYVNRNGIPYIISQNEMFVFDEDAEKRMLYEKNKKLRTGDVKPYAALDIQSQESI